MWASRCAEADITVPTKNGHKALRYKGRQRCGRVGQGEDQRQCRQRILGG
jgi:hypothetical protein